MSSVEDAKASAIRNLEEKTGRSIEQWIATVKASGLAKHGQIVAHLKAHGARVGDIGIRYGAEGEGPSIYVLDPEDNVVELKGPPIPGSRVHGKT